jgi:hypothetical protein
MQFLLLSRKLCKQSKGITFYGLLAAVTLLRRQSTMYADPATGVAAPQNRQRLAEMGMPEYEAKRYEGHVKNGGILVSAHCDNSDWVTRAKDILKEIGADDISSAGEKSASTHGVNETPADRVSTGGTRGY